MYSENWVTWKTNNALWDAMKRYWDEDVQLILYGVHELEYLYLKKEMEYIIKVFNGVHKDTPNVTFEIISQQTISEIIFTLRLGLVT